GSAFHPPKKKNTCTMEIEGDAEIEAVSHIPSRRIVLLHCVPTQSRYRNPVGTMSGTSAYESVCSCGSTAGEIVTTSLLSPIILSLTEFCSCVATSWAWPTVIPPSTMISRAPNTNGPALLRRRSLIPFTSGCDL